MFFYCRRKKIKSNKNILRYLLCFQKNVNNDKIFFLRLIFVKKKMSCHKSDIVANTKQILSEIDIGCNTNF